MAAIRLLADVVLPLGAEDRALEPGWVQVEGAHITAVGSGVPETDPTVTSEIVLRDRLLMPGLVNAHTHSPMVLFRGLAEGRSLLTFEGWYETIRVWEEVLDPDWIAPAVALSCAEMIRTGTTCFADQYFFMDQIVPVVRRSGLRAALAYGIVEMGDEAVRRRELTAAERFLESVQAEDRLYGWIGPHAFFVDNSPAAIEQELALADRFDAGLHIHLSTSGEEDRYCQDHFGRSAVAQMAALGVLERRLLAAHCLTVPQEDFPALAAAPFTAVICASACMRSGAAAAPAAAMQAAGINLALGTDNVANNNSYDLFQELQLVAKLNAFRERRPGALAARDLLHMATEGGARALGLEDEIGSLSPGKQADLISLDLREIGWAPRGGQDLASALVYSVCGMHVRDVMVAGEWLYRDGNWTTIDVGAAVEKLEAAHAAMRRRRAA